ncbi:MAG TPA: YciI family protein [Arenibaculum sp.]|nr:YciI family protein [Arenibaculum sp.]
MFVVLLKFSDNKDKAADLMKGHNDWIKKGLDDGKFLLIGRLKPNLGGAILAHGLSLAQLQARVDADPFVAENVVKAEILEISPGRADPRLEFLLE